MDASTARAVIKSAAGTTSLGRLGQEGHAAVDALANSQNLVECLIGVAASAASVVTDPKSCLQSEIDNLEVAKIEHHGSRKTSTS